MSRIVRTTALAAAAVISLSALAACGGSSSKKSSNPLNPGGGGGGSSKNVIVGSGNFPESTLVGEIYAQALEAKGIKVTRKFDIGAREVYYPQVQSGAITIMPEYNGALLANVVDKSSTATTPEQVDAALTAKLPPALQILNPSIAQDKDSVTVTKATATKYNLKNISDLKNDASKLVMGGPPEFQTRTQGIVGLKSVYGLTFKRFQPLDEAGPVSVSSLKSGRVDAADIFTTDPAIAANGFVPLNDDKNLFTAQNVIPLVYKAGINATITSALNAVSAKLDQSSLLAMDVKVITDKADSSSVAKDWLKQVGLA